MTHLDRGLDLSDPEHSSEEEASQFRDYYQRRYGRSHPGLNFWLDNGRPDVVKRYRAFAETATAGRFGVPELGGFVWALLYPAMGFEAYIPRQVHMLQDTGFSRAQILELYAIAFLEAGPRGMETVAVALDGHTWREPESPVRFPAGWEPDPEAFRSGLDFENPDLTAEEQRLLDEWYQRYLGEIPRHARFLARHRPDVLKAYRNRFEHLVRVLPKQIVPAMLLHHNVVRGMHASIRENVLLARGFGMTKTQTLQIVVSTGLYGVSGAIGAVEEAAGDIFAGWD